jgi:transcriptional regulator NrdR family protein
MLKEVLKKGGKREKFEPEKIKRAINFALEKTELSSEKKKEIFEKVFGQIMEFLKDKREIATVEIEAKILLELDKICPQAAKIWRDYRLAKKKS